MGVVMLVRHGQASLGTANYDNLSDLGRRQARLVGARLAAADLRIDRVVCGTLVRQRDTLAELLSQLPGQPDEQAVDERLDEYDHGSVLAAHTSELTFEGATDDTAGNLQSALDRAIISWMSAELDVAETHRQFVDRACGVLDDLCAQPGTTIAVTSGGVIAVIGAVLLGLPEDRWPDLARVSANAAITKVLQGRRGRSLVTFNDHAHLEIERSLITYR